MSKINCEVIEDILPIYVENMASPSTRELVEEHLADCEACRQKEAKMHGDVQLPMDRGDNLLSKLSKQLFRKKATAVAVTVLSMLLLCVLCMVHLNSPIAIPYEAIADSVEIGKNESGRLEVNITDNLGGQFVKEDSVDEDGVRTIYIHLYTTRLRQLQKMNAGSVRFQFMTAESGASKEEAVGRVYYYPSEQTGEAVCIYEDEAVAGHRSGGVIVLPRLTQNYYTAFAVLLVLIGVVCCFIFRKKQRHFWVALKITLFPAAYVICSMIVLRNKQILNGLGYYISGILIATIVLYAIAYWIVEYIRYRKGKDMAP